MSFVIFGLTVSTIFAVVCFAVSSYGGRPGRAALLALLALIPSVLSISGPWVLQTLATAVLGGLVVLTGYRSKWAIAPALLLPMALSYWCFLSGAVEANNYLAGMRERYPLVSVDERLAFERVAVPPAGDSTSAETKLPGDVEARLAFREERATHSWRLRGLKALHGDATDDFVRAAGFGINRMPSVTHMIGELPDPAPIPLPTSPDAYPSAGTRPQGEVVATPPTRNQAYATHLQAEHSFFDPERMGYAESRQRTVGFEPHGFAEPVRFRDAGKDGRPGDRPINSDWIVVRLELVSLLKHDPPSVYVSKHLPRMDELKDVATRPLDAFEREAVTKLRRDDDVIVEDSPGGVRMVGALRAGNDCLKCHHGRRGDLLGAFSYELRPAQPAPKRPVEPAKPQAGLGPTPRGPVFATHRSFANAE